LIEELLAYLYMPVAFLICFCRNDSYGGDWGSFNFSAIEQWISTLKVSTHFLYHFCVCVRTCVRARMCVRMCTRVCVCVCVCVCTYIKCI